MSAVRVTFKGFHYNPAGAVAQVAPILRKVHNSLTRQIETSAKHRVPVLTGHLGRSIRQLPQVWAGALHVIGGVTAWAHYAVYVHEGTRPHVIRPRNPGGVLHFTMNGRSVFARSVNHPGTAARPFLRNAGIAVMASDPRVHI